MSKYLEDGLAALARAKLCVWEARLFWAIRKFDLDGDGALNGQELRTFVQLGLKIPADVDGVVDYIRYEAEEARPFEYIKAGTAERTKRAPGICGGAMLVEGIVAFYRCGE
jgi:hypothetical protein